MEIKEKIAYEWKLDLGVFSVSRKSETETPANRYARLQAVVDFISQNGDVGSVDEPGEYIQDTLSLKCGPYEIKPPEGEPDIVYFGGATENTVVGLGGSARHVIGNVGASKAWSRSLTPYLLAYLVKGLNLNPDAWKAYCTEEPHALDAIYITSTDMDGPEQRLEFLAKKLLYGPSYNRRAKNRKVLLATPIYVAMAE
jgi:hypothetical protein